MKIISARLYKLPIDNSYKNILSFSKTTITKDLYATKIDDIWGFSGDFIDVEIDDNRYFNENRNTTLNCRISLNMDSKITSIYSCNYIIIKTEFDILFYFISDYKVNNSMKKDGGEPNPTYTLFLEWDSWSNNISNSILNSTGFCVKKTDNRFGHEALPEVIRCVRNNKITDFNAPPETITKNVTSINPLSTFYNQNYKTYVVLWKRLFFERYEENGIILNSYFGTSNNFLVELVGAVPRLNPLRIVYVPVAVVNVSSREIDFDFKVWVGQKRNESGQVEYSPEEVLEFSKNDFPTQLSDGGEYLLNADLTFFAPITSTQIDFSTNSAGNKMLILRTVNGAENSLGYFHSSELLPKKYAITNIRGVENEYIYKGFDTPLIYGAYRKTFSRNDLLDIYNSTDNDKRELVTPQINLYPYKYNSIICGSKKIDLKGGADITHYSLNVNWINRLNIVLRLTPNKIYNEVMPTDVDKRITNYTYCGNNGNLIIASDSLSEYLRNNSASLKTSSMLASISAALGMSVALFSGGTMAPIAGIGAALTGASKLSNINASIADANNARDSYTSTDLIAPNDVEWQDDLVIVETEILNGIDKLRVLKDLAENGIFRNIETTIFTPFNANYDFLIATNVELRGITNNEDKNSIKRTLENGTSIWYMDTCNESAIYNLNREYCNMSLDLYNYMIN